MANMEVMAGYRQGTVATASDQPNTVSVPFPPPPAPEGQVLKLVIDQSKLRNQPINQGARETPTR